MTLREYRTKHHLTLEELATASGMTKQNLALIEAGGNCRLNTAARIVAATGGQVSFEDLLVDPAAPAAEPQETTGKGA